MSADQLEPTSGDRTRDGAGDASYEPPHRCINKTTSVMIRPHRRVVHMMT
jgi:hypothetical protein